MAHLNNAAAAALQAAYAEQVLQPLLPELLRALMTLDPNDLPRMPVFKASVTQPVL